MNLIDDNMKKVSSSSSSDIMSYRQFEGNLENLKEVYGADSNPEGMKAQSAHVEVIGQYGSGKRALVKRCMGAPWDNVKSVAVSHKTYLTTLTFSCSDYITWKEADVYLVVFSRSHQQSYYAAVQALEYISLNPLLYEKIVILVSNRTDIQRMQVDRQGRVTDIIPHEQSLSLAEHYGFKYIEVSTLLDYNIEKLLIGMCMQVKLRDVVDARNVTRIQRLKNVLLLWIIKLRRRFRQGPSPNENFRIR